jgi:hypothetical protein
MQSLTIKATTGYATKGAVRAYVQFQQQVPKGFLRLGHWPVEVFRSILPPEPPKAQRTLMKEGTVRRDMCEVAPIVWQGRPDGRLRAAPEFQDVVSPYLKKESARPRILTRWKINGERRPGACDRAFPVVNGLSERPHSDISVDSIGNADLESC